MIYFFILGRFLSVKNNYKKIVDMGGGFVAK